MRVISRYSAKTTWKEVGGTEIPIPPSILLETSDYVLLENGDYVLLE